MKHLFLFVLAFTFVFDAMGQARPKCLVCKDAEFVDVEKFVAHSKPQEVFVEEITDTVQFVAKPAHQICTTHPVTGALCTVDVAEVKAISVVKLKKITTVQYASVIAVEPAMNIRYEAEITNDCNY